MSRTRSRRLVLIGERNLEFAAHRGIEASLRQFPGVEFRWVGTAAVAAAGAEAALGEADGIWCTPGSPYASTAGALSAIRRARERALPFLGTCGGFQHALMEYAANVLGRPAEHAEENPGAHSPVIARLTCSLSGGVSGRVYATHAAFAALLGGADTLVEFNCNYGLNPDWAGAFADTDLEIVARDDQGAVRAVRHRRHPFFVATLFQPERAVLSGGRVHPLIAAWVSPTGKVGR